MFYIKADITEAVILHTWVNTTAKTGLFFDKSFEVCILYYNENLDEKYQLQTQPYPLILELQSINKDLGDWCPYLAFQHNIHSQFYHMDKGESLTIWSQIVYPENRGLYIVVEHYGSSVMTWTQNLEYEIASGFCTKTMVSWYFFLFIGVCINIKTLGCFCVFILFSCLLLCFEGHAGWAS